MEGESSDIIKGLIIDVEAQFPIEVEVTMANKKMQEKVRNGFIKI